MKAITAYTEEIDDWELAADELAGQVRDFPLMKNSVGILFSDRDLDYESFYPYFSKKISIPLIGASGLAVMNKNGGFHDTGITLMVLTADDVFFSIGITEPLNKDNYVAKIAYTYNKLSAALPEKEKLIISYFAAFLGISMENCLKVIDDESGNVFIYGGLAADAFLLEDSRVYYNEKSSGNQAVFLLISGNISPRFLYTIYKGEQVPLSRDPAVANGREVLSVGNRSFVEVLRNTGMVADKEMVAKEYCLAPFIVDCEGRRGGRFAKLRILERLNFERGSGFFLGEIPDGSYINVGIFDAEGLIKSTAEMAGGLVEDIREELDSYSLLLCHSCAGRYLVLQDQVEEEVKACLSALPEGICMSGFYSYGEICPLKPGLSYPFENCFHNDVFTILAL